ncbi:hypothetical protein CPLU01_03026 [Colletotrichum plurivorum]|uniref:Uncharacterized protein n=1 Tax=Colletotrichum plurivorum TaxID=2175906 RepID=A0A8H6KTK8_9PEZI|nr:hypothetical protein CPLU01_03026 [Colletotrichum plurivorum]
MTTVGSSYKRHDAAVPSDIVHARSSASVFTATPPVCEAPTWMRCMFSAGCIRLTKDNPSSISEWQRPGFDHDATPLDLYPRSDWTIVYHIKMHVDLDVYMNQLGLKRTKVAHGLLM